MRRLLGAVLIALATLNPLSAAAEEQTKAIDFQFTDIAGKNIRLSDFKGKWVLVNFWAPWCPLCWVEVPALNQLNQRDDFVVIGIGLDYGPDVNVVRDAATSHSMDFYAIVAGGARRNPDSPFRQVGPVDFYPTSYVYDPNGEIVMFIPGQVKIQKVLAFVDAWGSKKNSQVAESSPAPKTRSAGTSPVKEVVHGQSAKPAPTSKKTVTY